MKIKTIDLKRVTCFLLSFLILLSSINVPAFAFSPAEYFTYTIDEESETVTITGLTDDGLAASSLDIPDTIEGKTVTTIAAGALGNTTAAEVTIPSSITAIGDQTDYGNTFQSVLVLNYNAADCSKNAFYRSAFANSNISILNIGESVITLDDSMFDGMNNLITVNYNANLESKAGRTQYAVFRNCHNLTEVNIGPNVTSIPENLFTGITSLTEIEFPSNVESIGKNAFSNTGLTTVTIPDTVTSIGVSAFADCVNLKRICIMTEIDNLSVSSKAFAGLAENSIIRVKNETVAALFASNTYTAGTTMVQVFNEYPIYFKIQGEGFITIGDDTDTSFDIIVDDPDNLPEASATADTGYHFVKWVDSNNNEVSTSNNLTTDLLEENEIYTAVFEKNQYTLNFVMDSQYGTLDNTTLDAYYNDAIFPEDVGINLNPGYTFTGWEDSKGNIVPYKYIIVTENETYTAKVEKTLYEYTINVYYNDVLKHTHTDKAASGTVIDTYEGLYTCPAYWKFDKVENMPLTVTTDAANNVMNVYYVTNKENYDTYTVNYYYDDVKEKSIEFTVPKGTVLETVAAQNKDGFAFDRVEGLPAVVTDGVEVNVYYISEDTQQFTYTIEYYYDDVLDEIKTESVIVNAGDRVGTLNTKITANLKAGYEYKSVTYELPTDVDGNIYTVLYYYDDVVGKTEGDVNIGDIEDKIQENLKDGYVFVHMDKYSDLVVNSNGITIKVNYTTKVEEEPADEYTYTVEYYYNNVLDEEATETYTFPAGSVVKGIQNKTRNGTWLLVSIDSVPVTLDKEGIVIKAYYLPRGNQIPAIDSKLEVDVPHDEETPPAIGEDFYTEITQDEHGNPIIKIYYKSDMKEVKTEYYYDGVIDESLTKTETLVKGTVIEDYEDKIKDGYVFDKVENLPLTVGDDNNSIKVYYKTKTVGYTVEYYFDNVLDKTLTENKSAKPGTVVESYTDKVKDGYSLDKVEGLPLTVTENGNNTIKVYYKLDKYTYTINYYYDGVINDNLTETGSAIAGTVIDSYTDNLKENYVFDKTVNYPLTISKDGNNVIEVHYKTKTLDYMVEYYFEGTIDSSLTETYNVKVNTIINSYEDKVKENYILDKVIGLPLTVTDGNNNIIQVYYKLDMVDYRIEYYFDGVIDDTKTENKSDVVNTSITEYTDYSSASIVFDKVENNPMVLSKDSANVMKVFYKTKVDYIVHYYVDNELDDNLTEIISSYHGDVITTYPDKSEGLTFVKDENVPLTVDKTKDNVIKVYYKTPVNYKVEYYYDNVIDDSKTETGSGHHGDVISSYTDKSSNVYEFVKVMNHPLTLDKTSENVIKVFYKTKQFTYTVEYYYDNVKDNSKTDTFTVNINTEITSYADKAGEYVLDRVEGIPTTIVDNNSVVKVYYKTEMLDYKVEYHYDGILDASKTDTFNVAKGTVITTYTDKMGEYIFDKAENLPLTVSKNGENVIKVYYKTEMLNYTVNYYYGGFKDESKTDVFTVAKNSVITTYTDKSGSYILDKVIGLPLTVTKDGPNLINVYYVMPAPEQVTYKVEYYYDGVLDNSKTDEFIVDENTIISKYIDKAGEYIFDKVENLPLKVVDGGNNVIKVFYKTEMIDYKVEYYYNNVIDNQKTDVFTVGKGTIISTYTDKVIENYVLDKTENLPLTVTKDGNNTIKVYYKLDQVSYQVEYYYDNVIDSTKTDTFVVDVNTVVNTYVDKSGSYVLDKVENLPLTVVKGGDNVIKVYYVEPIHSYEYRVEYYYNGTMNNDFTEVYTVEEGTVITTYTDKANGYKFSRVENLPLTVSSDEAANVIKVYYTKSSVVIPTYYKYTVEYYFDGVIDNNLTDIFRVKKGTTIRTYTDKVKDCYVFDYVENIPLTVKDNSGVIKVFYKTPEPEDITYSVEYYYNNKLDSNLTEIYSVKPGTVITSYVNKIKSGYELDKVINLPLTVEEGKDNVIKVYYEKEEVIIADITYKVEYYYDNILDNSKTDVFSVKPGTVITSYTDKLIDGYKFVKDENVPLTVTTTNNVIKVFYEKIPPVETTYKVEYYYNNKLEHTDVFNATVGQIIEWVADRPKDDFKKDRTLNLPLTIVEDASKNVIKVYYVRDDVIQTGFPYDKVGIYSSVMLLSMASIIALIKKRKQK